MLFRSTHTRTPRGRERIEREGVVGEERAREERERVVGEERAREERERGVREERAREESGRVERGDRTCTLMTLVQGSSSTPCPRRAIETQVKREVGTGSQEQHSQPHRAILVPAHDQVSLGGGTALPPPPPSMVAAYWTSPLSLSLPFEPISTRL